MHKAIRSVERAGRRVLRPLKHALIRQLLGAAASNFRGHADQAFGHLTYAQHGEDLVFLNIFHSLGITRPSYLDIGAHHPINISNTALLHARGSRGINVDANPDLIGEFRRLRPDDVNLNIGVAAAAGKLTFYRVDKTSGRNSFSRETMDAFVAAYPDFPVTDTIEINVITIDEVVRRYAGGRYPNLLSIDVEGLDYDILSGADFSSSRPDVICAEAVSGGGGDESARFASMLRAKGYVPVFKTVGNVVFVAAALADKVGVK